MEIEETFKCEKCGKSMPQMNKFVHIAQCSLASSRARELSERGSQQQAEERPIPPFQYRAQAPGYPTHSPRQPPPPSQFDMLSQQSDEMSGFRNLFKKPVFEESYPQVDSKHRVEEVEVDPRHQTGFRCPKCTNFVPDKKYKAHLESCPYTACEHCYDYYPNEIIKEHRPLCEKNPNSEGTEHSRHESLQQTPNHPFDSEDRSVSQSESQELRSLHENESPNFWTPPPVHILRLPLSELVQIPGQQRPSPVENPFFIFFRNREHQFNSPQQEPRVIRRTFINGREVDPDANPIQDIFQLFMDHGNFMRQNRHTVNGERLFELLRQLANPNRGVDPARLNRIEKKIFRKQANVKPGEEEKCPICITEFEDGEEVKNLPCNHLFHGNCIDTWLVQNSHCPICKADLNQQGFGN